MFGSLELETFDKVRREALELWFSFFHFLSAGPTDIAVIDLISAALGIKPELHACQTSTLPTEQHLQPEVSIALNHYYLDLIDV